MYRLIVKPILFLIPPESAHHFVTLALKIFLSLPGFRTLLQLVYKVKHPRLSRTVFGITFENPVGLAAGFDKDAKLFSELSAFGFGFIEVGTVTPLPQIGNDTPRLFRLPEDEALINRMGFNNDGVEAMAARLRNRKKGIIIGGNIGKNKITPNEDAVNDYEKCFTVLFPCVDYFVVNVSSPNTPGLRSLQEKEPLKKILNRLKELGVSLAGAGNQKPKPILLKIAPDLTNEQLDDIIEIVTETDIDGIVAANTTISRTELKTNEATVKNIGPGGLSGKPLTARSTEVIRYLHSKSGGKIPIIGSGGIHSAQDAIEKLNAGASLIQLYTGFVYEGPGLIRKINRYLLYNSN